MTHGEAQSIHGLYDQYLIGNYGRSERVMVRGAGARIWDAQGRRYLDFASGIATNTLGHAAPELIARLENQMRELIHCSNLYRHEAQARLAEKLVQGIAPGKVFFCNSGAEANEALIKLARLHGVRQAGREGVRHKIVCAENAFHGRTFGGMSATPKEKVRAGFGPLLEGFVFARRNDIGSFAEAIDEGTAAVFLETVQGEGGVFPMEREFFRALRALCDERGVLLMADEVQCGIGRTGTLYAFQHHEVPVDAVGLAKGLGGGFPIGAIWAAEAHAGLFAAGTHGSTFGGGPLACTAALAVLEAIEEQGLLQRVREQSGPWRAELEAIAGDYPALFSGVRGIGYLQALVLREAEPAAFAGHLANHGLLAVPAANGAVRLLPPLNTTSDELEESIVRIRDAATDFPPASA